MVYRYDTNEGPRPPVSSRVVSGAGRLFGAVMPSDRGGGDWWSSITDGVRALVALLGCNAAILC